LEFFLAGVSAIAVADCFGEMSASPDPADAYGTAPAAGYGDSAAPGKDCPETFDPDAVYE
jgi:hypothetical protein